MFRYLKDAGVKTTSGHVTRDPLSGLKQCFIDPCHAGFFIELIERPEAESSNSVDAKGGDQQPEEKLDSVDKVTTHSQHFSCLCQNI